MVVLWVSSMFPEVHLVNISYTCCNVSQWSQPVAARNDVCYPGLCFGGLLVYAPVEAILVYATPDCIPVDRVCMCMCYKCTEQATLEYAPAESILLNATPGRFSGGFLMYIYLPHKCSAQESQCAYCDVSLDYVPVAAEICDMLLRTMLG